MSRKNASLAHFILSLLIFSVIFSVLILKWYPTPYFSASGGWQGLRIAALVDLVLGPFLTFIVVKQDKALGKIKFDLIVIVLMQFTALSWGVMTIYQQRPVVSVLWEDSFYTVPAQAFDKESLRKISEFGDKIPAYVVVNKPRELAELQKLSEQIEKQRRPPYELIERYEDLEGNTELLQQYQLDINEIMQMSQIMANKINDFLDLNNKRLDDYIFVPLRSKYRNIILAFDKQGSLAGSIVVPESQ